MQTIRLIENENDQKQASDLAAYCFVDETGLSKRIFPLGSADRFLGLFDGETLASAVLSKGFLSSLFGEVVPSSGISCVVSSPQYRNRNFVKLLLTKVIKEDYEKGKLFSALYPFLYRFYQKFGYGSLGPASFYTIDPRDIRLTGSPSGQFAPFLGTDKQLDDYYNIHNKWVQTYDFGIVLKKPSIEKFQDQCKFDKDNILLYYGMNGDCEGFIRFHLKTLQPFVIRFELRRIAWAHVEAFKALMHILWVHRNQCQEITWTAPLNVPINWITMEPRIDHKYTFLWMARPLNLQKLLSMKAEKNPINGKFTFSVKDEIIPENSGTYTIEGNTVVQESFQDKNTLTLDAFSSLLFGGISLKEALLAELVNYDFPAEAENFFSINRNIYISEWF